MPAASGRSAIAGGRAWRASSRPSPATSKPEGAAPGVRVVVHVDGGSRGNPGPAAAAAVVSTPDGEVLDEAARVLGVATNNVAEYRGLLLGLERARALGATEVEIVNDSELVAHQVTGRYKVKHADMRALHGQAMALLGGFDAWSIRPVPRAENAAADALVNQALDAAE